MTKPTIAVIGAGISGLGAAWALRDARLGTADVAMLTLLVASGFEPLLALPGQLDLRGIDWVIVGGESGPRARPFNVAWARTIIEWCRAIGAVPFVKQMGAVPLARDYLPPMNSDDALETLGMAPVSRADVRSDGPMREWPDGTHFGNRTGKLELNGRVALMKDGHGADPLEWPEDLRVQEFPAAQENPNA